MPVLDVAGRVLKEAPIFMRTLSFSECLGLFLMATCAARSFRGWLGLSSRQLSKNRSQPDYRWRVRSIPSSSQRKCGFFWINLTVKVS